MGRDQYGLLVPVDSLECNSVLMSLRAQKDSSHPDKSEQTQRVRKSKINSEQAEIKRQEIFLKLYSNSLESLTFLLTSNVKIPSKKKKRKRKY